jgi:hypothetical protein
VAKAAKVTRPGGTLARFWSYHLVDEPMLTVFEAVYGEHAPEAHVHGRSYRDDATAAPPDPLAASASFGAHERRRYRWEQTLTAAEWIGLTGTFSDHQRLGAERLAAFHRALRAAIESHGGVVRTRSETFVLLARRV